MNPEHELLLTDWFRRARESQRTHYECGTRFSRFNYFLGIPTIVLSTAVGTAVFASVQKEAVSTEIKIVIGLVSILAAVLASLQTFLGFAQRADRHRIAGAGYGAVRRSLEVLKSFPPTDPAELKRIVGEIQKQMNSLAESAPEVPAALKMKIDRELKSRAHKRIFNVPAVSTAQPESADGG
jgi:hypothetical protein